MYLCATRLFEWWHRRSHSRARTHFPVCTAALFFSLSLFSRWCCRVLLLYKTLNWYYTLVFFFHSLHFMHCVRSSFSNILPEFVCGMLLCYDPYFFRLPSMSTITYLLQTMTRHRDATDTYETNIHSRWYRISRAVVFAAHISIWTVLVRQTDMRHLFLWWGSI